MNERPAGARISVLATWREALVFTARHAPVWLTLSLVPLYALTILSLHAVEPLAWLTLGNATLAGLHWYEIESIAQGGLGVVALAYATLIFPTLLHEICLAEPHERLWPVLTRWGRQRWHAIAVHTIVMIMASVGGSIIGAAALLAGLSGANLSGFVTTTVGPSLAIIVAAWGCVGLIYSRFALAVPNVVAGRRGGLGEASRLVRGNYWRLFVAGAVPWIATIALLSASMGELASFNFGDLAGAYCDDVVRLLQQFVLFAGITVHISTLAFFYRRLRDHVPLEVFD